MFLFTRKRLFPRKQCDRMTFSYALPVQFWLSNCETYNEYEAQGVHHVCWCQPWNCDDEIVIQFQDTAGQDLILIAQNSENVPLFSQAIAEIQSGVYQTSFIPVNQGIDNQEIQLLITDDDVDNIERLLAPSSWTDTISSFDVKNSTLFGESLTSSDFAIEATQSIIVPAGTFISFSYQIIVNGTWTPNGSSPIFVSFYVENGSGPVAIGTLTATDKTILENGTYNYTEYFSATTDETTILKISLISSISTGTAQISIIIPVDSILYVNENTLLAKSDCLDIQTSHDETVFFEYSNQRNFDGLIYANDSPDTSFGIRVPCRFVHEEEPEEDEAMELTSSIITTSSQVKTQRLLEIKHAPYYFHKKLRRVLKHQTLTAFNKSWKKEEKYQLNEGNMRWPLKSATCLLTEKNSVVRNVL